MSVIVIFGIQPKHIKLIEDTLAKHEWPTGIYNEWFWGQIGKEIGWAPFTIALAYFRHLAGPNPSTNETKGGEE